MLVDTYKSAPNWVAYSSRITAIETITIRTGLGLYEAEPGMMWGEWIETPYNTDGFYVNDDGVIANSNSSGFLVGPSDIIDEDTYYDYVMYL